MDKNNLDGSEKKITPPNFNSTRSKVTRKKDTDIYAEMQLFKEEMKTMITTLFSKQEQELKNISPTLKDIQQSNRNIEATIAFLSSQNDEFKLKLEKLERQSKEDKKYITILEERIEDLQRGSRKNNFEIKNVPNKNNETKEDLIEIVACLSKSVSSNLSSSHIKDIYRVKSKKEGSKNSTIVVETTSSLFKIDLLKMCKMYNSKHKTKLCAKDLGFHASADTPVFISEQLTQKGSRLYFLARDLTKSKKYKFCWTAYGNIYVRKDENSSIISIKSESQINLLLQGM